MFDQTFNLVRTLVAGDYRDSSRNALDNDFIGGESQIKPALGMASNGHSWNVMETKDGRFNFNGVTKNGHEKEGTVVYLSFWLRCPVSLNEIMADPNVPNVSFKFSASGASKIWLNGQPGFASVGDVTDTVLKKMPLIKGWNHFLIKVVKSAGGWSFSGKLFSKDFQLLSSMQSALDPYSDRANFYVISHTDPEIRYDQYWRLQGDGWYESSTPGSTATFKFYGTGIDMTGLVGPNGGTATISLDGKPDQVVNYYRPSRNPKAIYYSRSGLKNGEHEIQVKVIKGVAAIGPYTQWESYK